MFCRQSVFLSGQFSQVAIRNMLCLQNASQGRLFIKGKAEIIHNSSSSLEQLRKVSQLLVLWQESNLRFCDAGAICTNTLILVSYLRSSVARALLWHRKSVSLILAKKN